MTDAVAALGPDRVVALGGTGAVPEASLQQAAGGRPTGRLSGPDRFATAAAVSRYLFGPLPPGAHTPNPRPAERVYLARSDRFPDALAGGVLVDGPILLVPPCSGVPQAVRDEIARLVPSEVVALGGQAAVCETTLRDAASTNGPASTVVQLVAPQPRAGGAFGPALTGIPQRLQAIPGAVVTFDGVSGRTDASGVVVLPGLRDPDATFAVTGTPAPFNPFTYDRVTCRGAFSGQPGSRVCTVFIHTFTQLPALDYEDGTFLPHTWIFTGREGEGTFTAPYVEFPDGSSQFAVFFGLPAAIYDRQVDYVDCGTYPTVVPLDEPGSPGNRSASSDAVGDDEECSRTPPPR